MKRLAIAVLFLLAGCDKPIKVDLGKPDAPKQGRFQMIASTRQEGLPAVWRMDVETGAIWFCTATLYSQQPIVYCQIGH